MPRWPPTRGRGWDQTAGEAWIRAALSYHFGKFVWMLDMARHDLAADRAVAAMAPAHRLLDPAAERIEIPFGGAAMVGNLRRPACITRPPLVLLIAGLDSTKEVLRGRERLPGPRDGDLLAGRARAGGARAGAAHSARFRGTGGGRLDVLCGRPDLDGTRVGMLGVSLGGYSPPAPLPSSRVSARSSSPGDVTTSGP